MALRRTQTHTQSWASRSKTKTARLRTSDQLLSDIADRFQDLPNGPEKAAVAMDIFGRSGQKMITLLNGGSEALDEFGLRVKRENFARNSESSTTTSQRLELRWIA